MAVTDQTDTMFAGNLHEMEWAGLLDHGGPGLLNLTGRIVKFALAKYRADDPTVPKRTAPLLDFNSEDHPAQVAIVGDPLDGHVLVTLLPADTAGFANNADTDYHFELEVFEGDESDGVVVATGKLTIKVNVDNAAVAP